MIADNQSTVNQRMRRLGLGISAMCMEMEKRGRAVRYCEVSAAFHGEPAWSEAAMSAILKTLEEIENERSSK